MELKKERQEKESQADLKKERSPSKDLEPQLKKRRAREYIEDIKLEFKGITWTSKEELRVYTKIVVGSTFVLGLSVYLVDLAIQMALNSLTWITRLTVG